MSRTIEARILPTVRELGIGVTAYGVLSRGLLSSTGLQPLGTRDGRTRFPRFQEENLRRNRGLVRALEVIAKEKGATTAQLATAWVLYRGDDIIPLIGARNRQRLEESLSALDLTLTQEELAAIERRYLPNRSPEHGMPKRKCPLWIANAAPGGSDLVGAVTDLNA